VLLGFHLCPACSAVRKRLVQYRTEPLRRTVILPA